MRYPTSTGWLLVSALVALTLVGCDRGQVGTEALSICVPEGACDESMFAQGLQEAPADPTRGGQVFGQVCASCHGPEGKGLGQTAHIDFTSPVWHARFQDKQIAEIIRKGRPPNMPPQPLSETQLRDVISYLRALRVTPTAEPGY